MQKRKAVVRSGQKWSEMKILNFIFRREYLVVVRPLRVQSVEAIAAAHSHTIPLLGGMVAVLVVQLIFDAEIGIWPETCRKSSLSPRPASQIHSITTIAAENLPYSDDRRCKFKPPRRLLGVGALA